MSDTPETDNLARGNHVVPTEWAEQLERERNRYREALQIIRAADWKTSGELRGIARRALENIQE